MPGWVMVLEAAALVLLLVTYGLLWKLGPRARGGRVAHAGIVLVVFSQVWFLLGRRYPAGPWHAFQGDTTWTGTLVHSIGVALGLVCVSLGFYRMVRSVRSADEQLRRTVRELERVNARLGELSATDELTRVYNYRFFVERLKIEMSVAVRQEMPFSCAIVDIDHFKSVNDSHGHACGDRVLAEVAGLIRRNLRPSDAVGRLGGDEFGILLPGTTYETALLVAERMRSAIQSERGNSGAPPRAVTVSVGLASFPEETTADGFELLKLADRALYGAKGRGRNQVCLARDIPAPEDGGPFPAAAGDASEGTSEGGRPGPDAGDRGGVV